MTNKVWAVLAVVALGLAVVSAVRPSLRAQAAGPRGAASATPAPPAPPPAPPPGPSSASGPGASAGTPTGKATYQVVDLPGIRALVHKARGHVVLVHFWASWCLPCLKELPIIDRFAREMRPRGLEVLSLSLDNATSMGARVGALLQRSAPNLTPNIAQFDDADDLIAAIDPRWVGAIPALFAYDHEGQLRGNIIGEASRPELDRLVTGLMKAASSVSPKQPP